MCSWPRCNFLVRSFVGLNGEVMWWVGHWVLWEELAFGDLEELSYFWFSLAGLFGLLISRSFLSQCGIRLVKPTLANATCFTKFIHVATSLLGWFSIVILWIGLYGLLLGRTSEDALVYLCLAYLVVGTVLCMWSDTSPLNLLRLREYGAQAIDFDKETLLSKCTIVSRACLGLTGDIMLWVAVDSLVIDYEREVEDQELAPKLLLCIFGTIGMFASVTMPSHAELDISKQDLAALFPNRYSPLDTPPDPKLTPSISISELGQPPSPSRPYQCICANKRSWRDVCLDTLGFNSYLLYWAGLESTFYFFVGGGTHTVLNQVAYICVGFVLKSAVFSLVPQQSQLFK